MNTFLSKISPIIYLYRKTSINRVKKALKKPVTYIYIVLAGIYLYMVFNSFGMMLGNIGTASASTITAFLTVIVFLFTPANLIAYSKRKGLIFRQSDIHFLFPSPIGPKRILLYSHLRTIFMTLIINIIMSIGGVLWFGMPVWKMLIYFLFSCGVENILEAALMILCYGNERFDKKQMLIFQFLMYALIGVFVIIGIVMYIREGAAFQVVVNYLHSDIIQMVPVIGWYIAFLHLLFMGPTAVNIICSCLFFASVVICLIMAVKMKCSGEYYEDAIRFAEDYEVTRQKSKKGEVAIMGFKKKYGKAEVTYRGSYAKALFYRQLLEYRKNRFFIFGFYTLLCLVIGIGTAVLAYKGHFDAFAPFVLLAVMAYLTFIFSSYPGKWGKELEKPYTYLIPDSSFHKLWYATLIEHIRSLTDGCLIALPTAVILRIPVIQTIMIIAVYVCMQACKLYAEVMVEAFLGSILGNTGKQFARIFFEGLVIGIGVIAAAVGTITISVEAGLLMLIIVTILLTAAMMGVASRNFSRMERLD